MLESSVLTSSLDSLSSITALLLVSISRLLLFRMGLSLLLLLWLSWLMVVSGLHQALACWQGETDGAHAGAHWGWLILYPILYRAQIIRSAPLTMIRTASVFQEVYMLGVLTFAHCFQKLDSHAFTQSNHMSSFVIKIHSYLFTSRTSRPQLCSLPNAFTAE